MDGRGREMIADAVPASLLHAIDRDRRLRASGQQDRSARHPVLPCADELLAVQDQDVGLALVDRGELRDRARSELGDRERPRGNRVREEVVPERGLVRAQ